MFIKNAMLPM
jgi:hypothetical protein